MGYVAARIEELKTDLASLPPVDPAIREINKLEAIRRLAGEIVALQKKGYRIDEVAQLLTEKGVAITAPTLKQYLYRLKQKRARRRAEQPGDTSATTAVETTAITTNGSPAEPASDRRADAPAPAAQPIASTRPTQRSPSPATTVHGAEDEKILAAAQVPNEAPPAPRTSGAGRSPVAVAAPVPRSMPLENSGASTFKPREDSDEL